MEWNISSQIDIIKGFLFAPQHMVEYLHYRGAKKRLRFRDSDIKPILAPIIPYNDPSFCCILQQILNEESSECSFSNIKALGPKGAVGVPYLASFEDEVIIAKLTKLDGIYAKYLIQPPTNISRYPSSPPIVRNCIGNIGTVNIKYIASDEFTNETLIGYIFNYLDSTTKIPPLFVRHYGAAICNDEINGIKYGLNLMENCDLGPLDKIASHPNFSSYVSEYTINESGNIQKINLVDEKIILSILIQISIALILFQKLINFTSGDLKAGNIFVKSDPLETSYFDIPISSPFTCKIADYGKSSCMIYRDKSEGIRFYNDNSLANFYLGIHPFEGNVDEYEGQYYYTVEQMLNVQLYTRTRHMGLPFYRSFDYYTVLLSMLTRPSFYYSFFGSDLLQSLFWTPIWKDEEDASKIMEKLRVHVMNGTGSSINDALDMIKGMKLRCDAIPIIIRNLREFYS